MGVFRLHIEPVEVTFPRFMARDSSRVIFQSPTNFTAISANAPKEHAEVRAFGASSSLLQPARMAKATATPNGTRLLRMVTVLPDTLRRENTIPPVSLRGTSMMCALPLALRLSRPRSGHARKPSERPDSVSRREESLPHGPTNYSASQANIGRECMDLLRCFGRRNRCSERTNSRFSTQHGCDRVCVLGSRRMPRAQAGRTPRTQQMSQARAGGMSARSNPMLRFSPNVRASRKATR